MNAQQLAEEVESAIEGLEADEHPVRRPRRRPLSLVPPPNTLRWGCPCEGCRDLLVAEIRALTETTAATDTVTAEDAGPLPASWYCIDIED